MVFEKSKIICLKSRLNWSNEILDIIANLSFEDIKERSSSIEFKLGRIYEKFDFSYKRDHLQGNSRCDCCYNSIPSALMTKVEGTYKFPNNLRTTEYNICPICIYLATTHEDYSNICSEVTTGDPRGYIEYRPTEDESTTNWCFVHPSIYSSDETRCCLLNK